MIATLVRHRELVADLVRREFIGRYRGSVLGVAWSLFNPLLMLFIYTMVFSVAFKARWGTTSEEGKGAFAIVLFSGLIVHGLFAECLIRAPLLVTTQPNFVKKVVFPLEVLPCVALLSALLHFLVSFAVLLLFCLFAAQPVHGGVLLVPLALLPLLLVVLGLSSALASLGVYFRDLGQIMGVVASVVLFLAPVFYPVTALPPEYRSLLDWNPITLPIEQVRNLVIWGKPFEWGAWFTSLVLGLLVCQAGYWWFRKTQRGFADVL
jgi:lipopolysaccharide transport system permease protein